MGIGPKKFQKSITKEQDTIRNITQLLFTKKQFLLMLHILVPQAFRIGNKYDKEVM